MIRKRRSHLGAERPISRKPGPSRRERLFFIAVEGEATEPDYLNELNGTWGAKNNFFIHVIARQYGLKPGGAVDKVLEVKLKDPKDQRWVMFDRDEHVGIPEAVADAAGQGVRVVFSHPSFDLWLLLHFEQFTCGRQNGSSALVQERLRRYEHFETYGLKSGSKKLTRQRLDALNARVTTAVRNARKLADDCQTRECSSKQGHAKHCGLLKRDPSTNVWELLEELGIGS